MKKFHFGFLSQQARIRGNSAALAGIVPVIIVLVVLLAVVGGMFVVVDAGHVGVVKRFGAVQERALPAGLHFKRPFIDQIEQIDIRPIPTHAKATAASKDLQMVSTEVTLGYSVNGELAPLTYQRIGGPARVAATAIEPAIQECVKAVTAKFTAEELVTKREVVKQQIQEALEDFINRILLEKDVLGAVSVTSVAITDFSFSDEFNRAIEAKVKAEQQALQARNEKVMRVTQAEASAEEQKLAAGARAFSIEAESVARAEAIRREAEALRQSPEIIRLRAVEKWDGILPRISGGSGVVPFLNINELTDQPSGAKPGS
jgi:prohibitin 2